jgi:pilus assembly protein Flp/PilA
MRRLSRLRSDDKAASAVEYALILALIVLAMMAALRSVANATINMWDNVDNQVLSSST